MTDTKYEVRINGMKYKIYNTLEEAIDVTCTLRIKFKGYYSEDAFEICKIN